MPHKPERAPVWAITGPTASGKTAVALALAALRPIEIISMDSALVYRGMDIGTAKPTAAERAQVPHHLLDIREPSESYSAAAFAADAAALIDAIRQRGREPVLVGGTLLYLLALQQGLNTLPQADASVRAGIERDAHERGWPAMHAELARVDPATAARLEPGDAQRIQRALEVWQLSGKPLSAHFAEPPSAPDVPLRVLALEPSNRAELHARIARRFDAMFAAGFLDEVRSLRARGDLHATLPSMRAVGYRQAWAHLDGEIDAATFAAQAIAATRQLAKRQLTWLRSMPHRLVVDCCAANATEQALQPLLRS
ncbi:MAG: tRNA (adenosine(37)-N6)-dimethylallyltransferase MiaA [Thiomonas sp.]|uniref:tRNA dimethylallyltransferase n=1 Tax=mine drainage metagenome TaxID=410659 RepID=E6PSJ3_9ZZZZ